MSAQQTPGRLTTDESDHDAPYQNIRLLTADGRYVATIFIDDAPCHDFNAEQSANARRLVACWNACEGVSTEALERLGTLDRARVELDVIRSQAVAQRDELLAALEKIEGFTLSQFMGPHDMALECVTVACDSIAKVKGGAA